jgi:hypothetical protein
MKMKSNEIQQRKDSCCINTSYSSAELQLSDLRQTKIIFTFIISFLLTSYCYVNYLSKYSNFEKSTSNVLPLGQGISYACTSEYRPKTIRKIGSDEG